MYLVDTNVISELRKSRPHGAVLAWMQSVPAHDLHVASITLGEIQAGIERTREQDPERAAAFELWADEIAATWQIIPTDAAIFRVWAKLMHRDEECPRLSGIRGQRIQSIHATVAIPSARPPTTR
jgi:predicted nucleic acid-binding protein